MYLTCCIMTTWKQAGHDSSGPVRCILGFNKGHGSWAEYGIWTRRYPRLEEHVRVMEAEGKHRAIPPLLRKLEEWENAYPGTCKAPPFLADEPGACMYSLGWGVKHGLNARATSSCHMMLPPSRRGFGLQVQTMTLRSLSSLSYLHKRSSTLRSM